MSSEIVLESASDRGMIRHFIVERNPPEPREWNPAQPDPNLPRDCVFLGKALVEMQRHLPDADLHVYLTWFHDWLPEYGPHVVAILVGEEWGLIPRYSRHVRMVARIMSQYPFLGIRKWWPLDRLKMLLTVKYIRSWVRHFRSWLRCAFPPRSWPGPIRKHPHIVKLPWGSASLVDVPMREIKDRACSYFFSGGINTGADKGYRKIISTPKVIARTAMVEAVRRMERNHPQLAANNAIAIHKATGELTDDRAYAQALMDAKVCLAPRGSVADTWRYFEGLKSGSVVITNPLPDEWYYRGAPVIQLDDWNELEETLIPLLASEASLEEYHRKSLAYWDEVCGENAVGRYLAAEVKKSEDLNA